jgi:hypothetical protein
VFRHDFGRYYGLGLGLKKSDCGGPNNASEKGRRGTDSVLAFGNA